MRILYGVQATGQGHISRARAMAQALAEYNIEVTWLFSGRDKDKLFDMQPFGDFLHRRGLTFHTKGGQLLYGATVRNNNLLTFRRDVEQLDISPFDLLVTDFEPVTAWAAKLAGRPIIGIGHQYAFGENTPVSGANWISQTIMHHFAPVTQPIGLHWHPYAANILPPILDLPPLPLRNGPHALVYLPFEDQEMVTKLLQGIPEQRFIQYAGACSAKVRQNVGVKPSSIETFKQDLASASSVICNSGFELISECLQWGKPVLTRPLEGQMEQYSNALSLQQQGLAQVIYNLPAYEIRGWLHNPHTPPALDFPDVAAALAHWLADGCRLQVGRLSRDLWQQTKRRIRPKPGHDRAA